jgi:uncharacterized membrane protein YjjB (DUF3815 family)
MTTTEMVQVLSGFVGTIGFAVLFNIRGKRLLAAAVGGLLSWLLFVVIDHVVNNEVITYFIVAVALSAYAEVMARLLKSPTTTFIITSLIPMIPGSSLYYTMVSAFKTDRGDFLQKGAQTLQLAAALALGIVAVTTVARLLQQASSNKRGKRNGEV